MTPVPAVVWVGEIGNICEKGGYCPTGSKFPAPCTPGTYSDAIGLASKDCKACPGGSYCDGQPDGTRTDLDQRMMDINLHYQIPSYEPTGLCDAGFYCPDTTGLTEGADHAQFVIADPGFYVPVEGSTEQTPCDEGYWNSNFAATVCEDCPMGYKCPS